MFKVMKKKDLDLMSEKIHDIGKKLAACQEELDDAYGKIQKNEELNESLTRTISKLEGHIEKIEQAQLLSDTNSVELSIENDLTKVTPTVKFRTDVYEKMVELGYLSDKDDGNDMAIQIALMTISFEALQQIIESFSAPVEDSE